MREEGFPMNAHASRRGPARSGALAALALLPLLAGCRPDLVMDAGQPPSLAGASAAVGAIYTTDRTATIVNANVQYGFGTDVYLSGGPQNTKAAGLADGTYYFQVTDPSGKVLLSTDPAACRQLSVAGGRVVGAAGPACKHANGTFNAASGVTPVQLAPFTTTPNSGGVYKAWLVPVADATISATDPKVLVFAQARSRTDNFKVSTEATPPQGSCQPSSSLSVLVMGADVVSYVPKGNWSGTATGVSAVNVEGSLIVPTLIATPGVVNSCASNSLTGATVCTGNDANVYRFSGTTLNGTFTSGGSGGIFFSGGVCTNCGIAMDATHDQAVIGLSIAGVPGFQFMKNLSAATPVFEPPFASAAGMISEDPLIDPLRNRLLSAAENNKYEIVDVTTTTSPVSFVNGPVAVEGEFDSSGEDCSTQIALAPAEFSSPSRVYIADITTPPAVFAGGTWSGPAQVQSLSESFLTAGASGIAVAQGTHVGVVTGEFGGDVITAIALPSASGAGGTPAITDWVSCSIGGGFSNGFDPHTVTAYRSPSGGRAVALLANGGASTLAVVDLTAMLNTTSVPRTGAGHGCASGTLPASVVSFVPVP